MSRVVAVFAWYVALLITTISRKLMTIDIRIGSTQEGSRFEIFRVK